MKRAFVLAILLTGCAAQTVPPAPVQESPVSTGVPPPPPPPPETTAIAALMESARADTAAGRLGNAAASIERALRIEPRNPRLWHQLALVRFQQRDYAQAQSLAARSNTLAGSDAELRAANQRLIDEARGAR